jgi:Tfp pilus assembly protein PilE
VAAILAILSAIAIPTYLNYIKNQRREGARAIAQTAATAAHGYWRKTGTDPDQSQVAALVFLPGGGYSISVNTPNITVSQGTGSDTVMATVPYRN